MTVPTLDFLFSKITDVHFGFAAYLIISVDASDSANGFAIAPPTAGVSGPHLLSASLPVTTSVYTPPVPSTTDYYFIWAAAPFPTPDTVGAEINLPNGPIPYGGQFSLYNNFGAGFDPVSPPGANREGFYVSLAAAASAAEIRNSEIFSSSPGPYIIQWFNVDPGIPDGIGGFGGFTAGHVAVTTPGVGSGASSMKQRFLIGPLPIGSYGYSVNFGGSSHLIGGVDAQLIFISGGNVTSFANFPGGVTVAGGSGGGHASAFSVNVTVGQNVNGADSAVVVDFAGGGGGGH